MANKLWWEFWPEQSAAAELDASLQRMGFDYIDVIYANPPPEGMPVAELVAATVGLVGSASAAPARPAASATSVQTVVLDCPGLPALVRPKTYILSCADGYVQLGKLSWTSWTPGLASATAVRFGAAPAVITADSNTQVTVTSPPGT